ncbi:class Ib ribonucleoside-diphosphate reductase assembly flavoprotein NrdI [Streptococcus marimammalium]|uniref:class Ib ribonucleoside-diphosphate reductase assembly flavoprotein NrdI n=1 Tax=Streptococcus marimammalium TaxID=269666 RepID=UPI0005246ABA|nr:class Ib ribonucleoside-diphosphate reductase assembly flavoprotein NrdI [Streptococcus marimammalium]
MVTIVFYSLTGQTRRFMKKLNYDNILELKRNKENPDINNNFILIIPTYEDGLDFVDDFLDRNHHFFKGVIGSGNRNFGPEFCHVARRLSKTYHVPVLYEYEFNGTDEDVEKVKGIIENES